jgi:endonuclease III
MTAEIVVPYPVQPDLTATMDIQIPALAWQPDRRASWRRTYRLGGLVCGVTVTADDHALRFRADRPLPARSRQMLARLLRQQFPRQVSTLTLDTHPVLAAMGRAYRGVVIMGVDPFEALVLTVLSQNRTGEIVRKVYPLLEARCGGMTPCQLAGLPQGDITELIRSAGPYKAPRLAAIARAIAADSTDLFAKTVTKAPAAQAMAYLTSLPGIGHKTAACVLVFAGHSTQIVPVDTHLFRVTRRLGLTSHNGALTTATRDATLSAMLSYGPDAAPAHFLFLLLGRATCTASAPRCGACFLQQLCPSAAGFETAAATRGPGT